MVANLSFIRAFLVILAVGTMVSCTVLPSIEDLDGLYKYNFPNMRMDGTDYTSENRLLLFQTSPNALYFETHLDWANGHSCDLSGIAELDLESRQFLLYTAPSLSEKTCAFTIRLEKDKLVFDDQGGACMLSSCGSRGSFDGVEFKYNTRHEIEPASIKRSPGFRRATQEFFEAGK